MKTQFLKSYGYIRWSSDQQEDGDSLRRQTDIITREAERLNLPLIQTFKDEGVSAYKGANLKAQWAELKKVLRSGDLVILENCDRLTRQGVHTLLNELAEVVNKGAGVLVCSPYVILTKDNYDKDLSTIIQGSIAKSEDDKKANRILELMAEKKRLLQSGTFVRCSSLPYWLKNGDGCFVCDEFRANIVRRIFDLYIRGQSLVGVARVLNADNIPTKFGSHWSTTVIHSILKGKAVLGYGNQFEENVKLYPAIISEDVFYSVQKRLYDRRGYVGRPSQSRVNIFKALLKCSKCGHPFSQTNVHGRLLYYTCKGVSRGVCDYSGIDAKRFETSFQDLLTNNKSIADIVTDEKVDPYKLDGLNGRLADCRAKQKRLADIITNDPNPSANLLTNLKALEEDDRKLLREISIEEAVVRGSTPVLSTLKDYDALYKKKWNEPEGRLQIRECIRSMVDKIVVNKQEKSYEVWFKTAKQPVKVVLGKKQFTMVVPSINKMYNPKTGERWEQKGNWHITKDYQGKTEIPEQFNSYTSSMPPFSMFKDGFRSTIKETTFEAGWPAIPSQETITHIVTMK